jgi:hypothetical protein
LNNTTFQVVLCDFYVKIKQRIFEKTEARILPDTDAAAVDAALSAGRTMGIIDIAHAHRTVGRNVNFFR